jgi:UDP-N-acetylmuramate: L-alanyl-gamma-D-glutamyl-meso-diaminopimelate ligase
MNQESLCDCPMFDAPAKVHLLGICGTGMASLAGMFHSRGYRVSGSDQGIYPPMSDYLQSLGIDIMVGYSPDNLAHKPDLAIVGNVIRKTNPEAQALENSSIPFASFPCALIRYFASDKVRIVVAGTHGKTTLSSMIAWILFDCGLDPGFMIGGMPLNFNRNFRLGNGRHFVIEGDEYDTAYFDKQPKFLHYAPDIAVITSCEFDHADIYRDIDQIKAQFVKFAGLLKNDGLILAESEDANVREITRNARSAVQTYGRSTSAGWSIAGTVNSHGLKSVISHSGYKATAVLPLIGAQNLDNAAAAIAAAVKVGISPERAMEALSRFRGVKRRQELLSDLSGILVYDDFAHHPTAVKLTCEGMKTRFPDRRLIAVFEPRTNTSRRAIFQNDYAGAFDAADVVVLREPSGIENLPESDRFSSSKLADDLNKMAKTAFAFNNTDAILDFLVKWVKSPDVALIMSNGNFDNLARRLIRELGESHEGSSSLR